MDSNILSQYRIPSYLLLLSLLIHQILCYDLTFGKGEVEEKDVSFGTSGDEQCQIFDSGTTDRDDVFSSVNVGDSSADWSHTLDERDSELFPMENGLFVMDQVVQNISIRAEQMRIQLGSTMGKMANQLILVALYDSKCEHSTRLITNLEQVVPYIDEYRLHEQISGAVNQSPPLLGKIDISDCDEMWFHRFQFQPHDKLPRLQFVLLTDVVNEGLGDSFYDSTETITTSKIYKSRDKYPRPMEMLGLSTDESLEILLWPYLGPMDTTQDIFDTLLHYWYRTVLSRQMNEETAQQLMRLFEDDSSTYEEVSVAHGEPIEPTETASDVQELLDLVPASPLFTVSSVIEIRHFIQRYGTHILHVAERDDRSSEEEHYIDQLLNSDYEDDDLRIPYIAFVQCRSRHEEVSEDEKDSLNRTLSSFKEFDLLAEQFVHRRDMVFFVMLDHRNNNMCNAMIGTDKEAVEDNWNGAIRVLRVFPNSHSGEPSSLDHANSDIEWSGFEDWKSSAYFHPSHENYPDGKGDTVKYNMEEFAVIQSTPPILFYDKQTTALMSFPYYRKLHLVLFVDFHSAVDVHGMIDMSHPTIARTRYAIHSLKQAALKHRKTRPLEDAVFLVVPSTSIKVMKNFGIDIWSWTDAVCNNLTTSTFTCPGTNDYIPILPMAMITSRRENDSHMRRYYLDSNDVMANDHSIETFLSNYFDGNLTPHIKSQQHQLQNATTESGVYIVTAESFESQVMQTNKHVIMQFFSPSCGHCKRFNTMWNRIARFIRYMNWESIIQVGRMDISTNEVFHNEIDILNVPSVYVFFNGSKDKPVKLQISGDNEKMGHSNVGGLSNITEFMDWIISFGRIDEDELMKLASL